tara:strand:+ start:416 stop:679 length:264 start_codon:yes stop_codon:yes gene_type:complete
LLDAIKYAVNHKPDIIIASCIMKQMGGRELVCVLSEIEMTSECNFAIATTSGKTKLDNLPETALAIDRKLDLINVLTVCLSGSENIG